MNWENWEASLVELKEQAILENKEGCECLSRSKVSSLAPVVADLRSARVGRCQANYWDRKVSFFMPKIKTEGLIRYQQIKVW